jgi:hypothetical protein
VTRAGAATVAGLLCWSWTATGTIGDAHAARFALLVGNDEGQNGDARLRFAESDTVQLAELLTRLGGFSPSTTVILLGRTGEEVRRALADLAVRLRAEPGENLALVYYSGHADAQTLHTKASALAVSELREAMKALPAATRVLIVDACQAGVLTRPKGGQPGSGFDLDPDGGVQGLAVLASSAGSELAQESDQLRSSVFTHYLEGGLAGLADRNRDGNVSLSEAFEYTSERTLSATIGTTTGPQHPTYRLDLSGHDDLILTRPGVTGAGYGLLRLDVPGWYFVRRRDGSIAAELVSRGDETLALAPGAYEITRREKRRLDVASVEIDERGATAISQASSRPVAFGQMVRKGEEPGAAYGVMMTATVRTALEELGASTGAMLAGRVELSAVSVELRLGAGRARHDSPRLSSTVWDLSASLALLRARDLGTLWRRSALPADISWAFGLAAGTARMIQRLDDGSRRSSFDPFVEPLLLVDVTLGRRLFVRAEVGGPLYALRVQGTGSTETRWRMALAGAVGAGTWF